MARPSTSTNAIVFNGAGAALLLFLGGYMINRFVSVDTVSACSERYPAGLQFALDDASGAPLSPIQLQGRAGFREWGLLENAVVETAAGKPWGSNLVVNLASTNNEEAAGQNGVGYVWPVSALQSAQSACLSYYAYLSKDVDLKSPGHLPGLIAEAPSSSNDGAPPAGFTARMGWSRSGDVGVNIRAQKEGYWLSSTRRTLWPREKWVRIDQEVQLNAAGKKSGAVRVWIDGELDLESAALALRDSPGVRLIGVSGDVGYSRGQGKAAAVKTSPFVVQWQ